MLKHALVAVTVLAACGKEKKDSPKSEQKPTTTEPAATKPVEAEKPAAAAPPLPELAGLFNCHAADPNGKNGPAAKDAKAPWALPVTLGGCATLPPVYGKADLGMTPAEAGKASKAKVESGSGYIYVPQRGIRYQFAFHSDEETGKVYNFSFSVDEEGFAQMKTAWGEPLAYHALVDDMLAWFNPTAKIKVTAEADKWNRTDPKTKDYVDVPGYKIHFVRYMPLADVLGPEGIVQKPLIGNGPEELEKRYPGALEIKSEAEHKAEMEKMGLDEKTKAQIQALGAGKASANLKLPETETSAHHLLVQPDWKDGKIVKYSFMLPFGKANDKVKNELLAQIVQSLGKPLSVKQDDYNKDRWVYAFKGGPGAKVELRSDILGEGWTLEVAPEK